VPLDRIKVKVNDDRITLTGVRWDFQRRSAERAVRELPGVRGISNLTTVTPADEPPNALRREVERQLEWEPSIDERVIDMSVLDGGVNLTGQVPTYAQKWNAE
jgi:osmotically-inducible protein OsmY